MSQNRIESLSDRDTIDLPGKLWVHRKAFRLHQHPGLTPNASRQPAASPPEPFFKGLGLNAQLFAQQLQQLRSQPLYIEVIRHART